jgi:hypothetical protein
LPDPAVSTERDELAEIDIRTSLERLIGSTRRECVDHVIVLGEMHLRQVLKSYAVLAATGYNFRRLIRWLRLLWRQILAALFPELLINLA